MSQLEDLLLKPVTEMTTEELEEHIIKLKRLRFIEPVVQAVKVKKIKSNKERQLEDLFDKLSPEAKAELMKMLTGGGAFTVASTFSATPEKTP